MTIPNMKCFLIALLILSLVLAVNQTITTKVVTAVVEEENNETHCITLVDINGEAWIWKCEEDEIWHTGEQVEIEFHNQYTADLYDDEIISIHRGRA